METIRAAVVADVASLPDVEVRAGLQFRSIGLDAIAEDPPPSADELLSHVRAGAAWIAELDGEIVGYAIASVVDDEGHIDQVSVVPEMQGRGIGRALVRVALDWSQRQGHPSVTLTTFVDVPWNGPWYERQGFRFLRSDQLGPELQAIRERERAAGLDISPRAAMRCQRNTDEIDQDRSAPARLAFDGFEFGRSAEHSPNTCDTPLAARATSGSVVVFPDPPHAAAARARAQLTVAVFRVP